MTDSVTKTFRAPAAQFDAANALFNKEGYTFSGAVRLLLDATIREGRIPRCLKPDTKKVDRDSSEAVIEPFIADILSPITGDSSSTPSITPEERLFNALCGYDRVTSDMTDAELREWASRCGLPDDLSISTISELRDSGLFPSDPWAGEYVYRTEPANSFDSDTPDPALKRTMELMLLRDNLSHNIDMVKHRLKINAVKALMEAECDPKREKGEAE